MTDRSILFNMLGRIVWVVGALLAVSLARDIGYTDGRERALAEIRTVVVHEIDARCRP